MGKYIVGITGASGSIYAKRLIEILLGLNHEVHLCMTNAAKLVLSCELGWDEEALNTEKEYLKEIFSNNKNLFVYEIDEIGSVIASGSFKTDGMVILPCSMGTLSKVANGCSGNILERAADVCIKEERKLIVVPREAPFSVIHLENMLKLKKAGAVIMPACPSFYHNPSSIDDLVDSLCSRILDLLGIEGTDEYRWEGL